MSYTCISLELVYNYRALSSFSVSMARLTELAYVIDVECNGPYAKVRLRLTAGLGYMYSP